jgi:hypothetical protein
MLNHEHSHISHDRMDRTFQQDMLVDSVVHTIHWYIHNILSQSRMRLHSDSHTSAHSLVHSGIGRMARHIDRQSNRKDTGRYQLQGHRWRHFDIDTPGHSSSHSDQQDTLIHSEFQ